MKVNIRLVSPPDAIDSQELSELANMIKDDCSVVVEEQKLDSPKGRKDGGLTVGIAIASLTVSAVSAFIAVLSYWQSTHPRYSLNVTSGAVQVTIERLSKEELADLSRQLQQAGFTDLKVRIRR